MQLTLTGTKNGKRYTIRGWVATAAIQWTEDHGWHSAKEFGKPNTHYKLAFKTDENGFVYHVEENTLLPEWHMPPETQMMSPAELEVHISNLIKEQS
jgi:hypothetical protein